MVQLRHKLEIFKKHNTEIVAVSFTGGHLADVWVEQTSVPFTLIIDEERKLYRAFGLEESFWGSFGLKSTWYYIKNLKIPKIWGNPTQLGGDFLLDEQGILRWSYRSQDNTDRPTVGDILSAVQGLKTLQTSASI